jgi:glycine/D-amino acid oxidase-like deaminating enzyme
LQANSKPKAFTVCFTATVMKERHRSLIIGQGLAGSILALTFFELGHDFVIIDKGDDKGSSWVAAGIANPITGRRLSISWLAENLFPFLNQSYPRWEHLLGATFFYPIPVFRPAMSVAEQNDFEGLCAREGYREFLKPGKIEGNFPQLRLSDGVFTLQSGWLDVPPFLKAVRAFFTNKGQYHVQNINYDQFDISTHGLIHGGEHFDRVIFSEGVSMLQNPWFNYLPLKPAKGEILELLTEQSYPNYILNRGCFLLPLNSGRLKIGATYSWADLDNKPSKSAETELLMKAEVFGLTSYQVFEHKAGIRPATKDRRPFIGAHPSGNALYIFNGFGSKGVSLIPYFAKELAEHLLSGKELMKEINISRFLSFYQDHEISKS